jgi:hypothetical protein
MTHLATGTFHVAPNLGLLAWTAFICVSTIAAAVSAAKGRWEWLLAGFVTAGVAWLIAAFLDPRPKSLWRRVFAGDRGARGASAG